MQEPTIEICPVTDPGTRKMAQKIWVFYGGDHEASVAEHKVRSGTPTATVGPARWLDQDEIKKEIMDWKERQQYDPCYLPYRLLSCTPNHIVWHVPAQKRAMSFEGANKPLSGKMLPVPPLVFATDGNSLKVFALDSDGEPPHPDAMLHVAPFPNTYTDGRVCIGTMPTFGAAPADAEKWTDAFFDSTFTHGSFNKYWTAVSKQQWSAIPPLKPTGIKLKAFIDNDE